MPNESLLITKETISVVTEDTENTEGARGWGQIQQRLTKVVDIPVSVLEQNMGRFLQVMSRVLHQAEETGMQPDFQLSEVELQVEIGGKGEIKLFAGGEVAGKGVIKLKFIRSEINK